jgi:radical SAM superfamily enzyme YgiQ (UPF0313 family)
MTKLRTLLLDFKSYYESPPLNLGLLVAAAGRDENVRRNMEFSIFEIPRRDPVESAIAALASRKPDLVGISCYAWNYKKIKDLLDKLSAPGLKLPPIVMGGPNSAGSFGDELLRRYPILSAVIEGEGEPAFTDICRSLTGDPGGEHFHGRNCAWRDASGAVVRPDIGHRIELLDDIPSPYLTGILASSPAPIFYETNRGCPYRCSFCYWGNGNAKIYRMSHARIREEMEFFAANKVQCFWIADANFGIFKDDIEIAEMMCEVSGRHGRPFRQVGVNWAKNSGDKVLEIANVFRRGGIECTTTLALQSVTEEAGEKARRYSMPSSRFTGLISSAEAQDLDTYTDIIWGLPGEDVEEYLDGLDAVISTGVPAILIHQLYLLPGTEFYERRDELGLVMQSHVAQTVFEGAERSEYWDYIVVSHPKMPREEQIRGSRIMGVSHMLHNHNLGTFVDFYLARYGVSHRQVYEYMDAVLLGGAPGFVEPAGGLLERIRAHIVRFATEVGMDEFHFYRGLSELIWFRRDASGTRAVNFDAVRELMQAVYAGLARHLGICRTEGEATLLREFVDYTLLVAPKPCWRAEREFRFEHDIHALWTAMHATINAPDRREAPAPEGDDGWSGVAARVRSRLAALLTPEFVARHRRPTTYTIRNPWLVSPSQETAEWLLSSRSKRSIVSRPDDASTCAA